MKLPGKTRILVSNVKTPIELLPKGIEVMMAWQLCQFYKKSLLFNFQFNRVINGFKAGVQGDQILLASAFNFKRNLRFIRDYYGPGSQIMWTYRCYNKTLRLGVNQRSATAK